MKNSIRIASFNCRNAKSSLRELQLLCKVNDVILLQETWLLEREYSLLNNISTDFYAKGTYDMNPSAELLRGRPYGGMAILWRKSIANICSLIPSEDRIMGINIGTPAKSVVVLNVYLPYDTGSNTDEYLFYLGKIDNMINGASSPYVFILGDYNANLKGDYNRFGRELVNFCKDANLVISDMLINTDSDRFTYLSDAHNTTSWIDHIVSTTSAHGLVISVDVQYDFVTSDHLPLSMEVKLENIQTSDVDKKCSPLQHVINWNSVSQQDIIKYRLHAERNLAELSIKNPCPQGCSTDCYNHDHLRAIDCWYKDIVNSLLHASEFLSTPKNNKYRHVLGWNDVCKEAHNLARTAFLVWVQASKPKHGPLYEDMRIKRSQFKHTLRQCRQDNNIKTRNSLAEKFLKKDSRSFWKEIKKLNGNGHANIASNINGVEGQEKIACEWQLHFQRLLNSTVDTSDKEYVLSYLHKSCKNYTSANDFITSAEVQAAIRRLKCGKSSGKDEISSEHLAFCGGRIFDILCDFFNCCITHAYLPSQLLDTVIVPIIKDKRADITDINNYRPIALTCIISKVLESIILSKYKHLLSTNSNQYGSKKGSSTDQCVFSLKQVTEYYISQNSPMYLAFLDASKAFDKVNHWILLRKLIDRKFPCTIIKLLSIWYSTQMFCVKWGHVFSNSFRVSNGVRQGGVLSSYLFCVYMDTLSTLLINTKVGCRLNCVCTNHLMYADDVVLIAPSPHSLQTLINCCELYAKTHEITYNVKKSAVMCIKPKLLQDLLVPEFELCGNVIPIVSKVKYLGVFITDELQDDDDISREISSIYVRGNMLIKCFRHCTEDVKTLLFKTFCTSFYCTQIWNDFRQKSRDKLKVAFNRIFRHLFYLEPRASVSTAMTIRNINSFDVILRKCCNTFKNRLETNCENNIIINMLVNHSYFINSRLFKRWSKELYSFHE
jgi:exonuclease III